MVYNNLSVLPRGISFKASILFDLFCWSTDPSNGREELSHTERHCVPGPPVNTPRAGRNVSASKSARRFLSQKRTGKQFSAASLHLAAFFIIYLRRFLKICIISWKLRWFSLYWGHSVKQPFCVLSINLQRMCLLWIYFCKCWMLVAVPDPVVVSILPCCNKGCPIVQ